MNRKDDRDNSDRTIIITEKVELKETHTKIIMPYFIQISGRDTGKMFLIENKPMNIGRDIQCHIRLDDPHVSRIHAEITSHNQEIIIKDLESTNGIFVNGTKIKEHTLSDGDKVLIGTRLYFKFTYQDSMEQNYQQSLYHAANIDSLTQLYNRKYFLDNLAKEFSFSKRNTTPLSLMMIDVDYFKKINDTYGHIAGDLVLKNLGALLQKNLRLENIACRYGGEEFAVILRNMTADQAYIVAERLRKEVSNHIVPFKEFKLTFTISAGIASLFDKEYTLMDDLIHAADENLYEAKQQGRNKTILKKAA